jgi:hypothetical protein
VAPRQNSASIAYPVSQSELPYQHIKIKHQVMLVCIIFNNLLVLGHETGKYDFVLFQGHFYTEAVAVQNTEF